MVMVLHKFSLVASSAFLFLCLRLRCFATFFLVTRLVREWVPWVFNFECEALLCSAGGYTGWGWEVWGAGGKYHHGMEGMSQPA